MEILDYTMHTYEMLVLDAVSIKKYCLICFLMRVRSCVWLHSAVTDFCVTLCLLSECADMRSIHAQDFVFLFVC